MCEIARSVYEYLFLRKQKVCALKKYQEESINIKKKSRRSSSSWVGKEESKRVITWVRLSKGRVAKGDDFDSAADVLMVKKIN